MEEKKIILVVVKYMHIATVKNIREENNYHDTLSQEENIPSDTPT